VRKDDVCHYVYRQVPESGNLPAGALEVFRSWGAKVLAIGGEGRGAV